MERRRIGLADVLTYVCSHLESNNIPYMLSGSVAMSAYTIPRFTRDIDLVVALQTKDVALLARIFAEDFYFHQPSVEEEIRRQGMFNVIDNQSGFKIDFVVQKQTAYRQMEFSRRRRDTVFGTLAWIVSLEDLVLSKLIWMQASESSLQKTDIENILEDSRLDTGYIQHWVSQLSLKTFGLL